MQEIIQWAKEHWNLQSITLLYDCSSKQVYSAESYQWGDVIIKVNRNIQELSDEYKML